MPVLHDLLGLDTHDLTFAQMTVRAVIVFFVLLIYLRLANKRFLGRYTAFDAVLAIILGSVISRAVNGQAPFGPTLLVSGVLLALHWVVSELSMRSRRISRIVKGAPRLLVENGRMHAENMRACHMSADDLLEDLRYEAHIGSLDEVEKAYLECNGKISALRRRATAPEARIRLR